jgi:hypothetical protein
VAAYLLLGIVLLGGLVLSLKWFAAADPKTLTKALRWAGFAAVGALTLYLALSGRFAFAIGAAVALLPWIARFHRARRNARNSARAAGFGGGGGTSRVNTQMLRMSLDHDTGDLDGEILDGPFAGQRLSQLTRRQLLDLLRLCAREDRHSAQLLEAYLDRLHPGWREKAEGEEATTASAGDGSTGGSTDGDGMMSRAEAYEILGLRPGASEAEIRSAYHRLISALHPDKGGSNYLAAKLNRARQVLLDR